MNALHKRIFDISYQCQTTHIGSCISCVNIIDKIYNKKSKSDIFCLGNSHAFLALAVILEKYENKNALQLFQKHGTHVNRDLEDKIFVSGGSLGMVESIALGIAISQPNINVFLLSSDGGTMPGIFWETLRIKADNKINNLIWYINCNGFGAFSEINIDNLSKRIKSFDPKIKIIRTKHNYPFLQGLEAHYKKIDDSEYNRYIKNA